MFGVRVSCVRAAPVSAIVEEEAALAANTGSAVKELAIRSGWHYVIQFVIIIAICRKQT
jgi:hypothetical protein